MKTFYIKRYFAPVTVLLLAGMLFTGCENKENLPPETSALTDTAAAVTTAEPVETEPVVPYYTPEDDLAYFPSGCGQPDQSSTGNVLISEDYRFYGVSPVTDSEGFNTYCADCVRSLEQQIRGERTARSGGDTVVTVDYVLYQSDTVYSCVFLTKTHTDEGIEESVLVRIYDAEHDTTYAPLDIYDWDSGYPEQLAGLMREGYLAAFAKEGMEPDEDFLAETCAPDPACFVNIALDGENLYFYRVYTGGDGIPTVLCSPVPIAAMHDYEIAVIEERRRKETETQEVSETKEPEDPVDIPGCDVSTALPASEAVDDAFFDDAVFIGNSLIVGFSRSVRLKSTYLASIGLNVKQFFDKEAILLTDGRIVTPHEALELLKFSKVYLMFGINELGWGSINVFINYYGQIIDSIRKINPDAVIYIQSILPVNEEKCALAGVYDSCINNVSVATFNQKIIEMCEDKDVCFVNVSECLTDDTGNLNPDATSDGVHIGGTYITRWLDYLKTHTVPVAD